MAILPTVNFSSEELIWIKISCTSIHLIIMVYSLLIQGCLAILSYDLEATSMIESSSKKNSNRYKSSATNLLSSNKLGENKKNKKKRTVKSFVTNIFLKPSNSDKYQLLGHMKSPTEISNESSTMNSLKNIYRVSSCLSIYLSYVSCILLFRIPVNSARKKIQRYHHHYKDF